MEALETLEVLELVQKEADCMKGVQNYVYALHATPVIKMQKENFYSPRCNTELWNHKFLG